MKINYTVDNYKKLLLRFDRGEIQVRCKDVQERLELGKLLAEYCKIDCSLGLTDNPTYLWIFKNIKYRCISIMDHNTIKEDYFQEFGHLTVVNASVFLNKEL